MKKVIGFEDFLAIKPGETVTFQFNAMQQMVSASRSVYRVNKEHPRDDVERYSANARWNDLKLSVTAIPKEKK